MGDALIHVDPHGFAILPERYCDDAPRARESLKRLLHPPTEVLMFAHGLPIVSRAGERLAALLNTEERA